MINKNKTDILDKIGFSVFICTGKGELVFVNKACEDLFGFTDKDLERGVSIFDAMLDNKHQKVKKTLDSLISKNQSNFQTNFIAVSKSGENFRLNLMPIFIMKIIL